MAQKKDRALVGVWSKSKKTKVKIPPLKKFVPKLKMAKKILAPEKEYNSIGDKPSTAYEGATLRSKRDK